VEIREILNDILTRSGADITVEVDPSRLRPVDVPMIEADIRKINLCTGWERKIPLEETLQATLEYWRHQIKGVL
ncbi:MAG: GDP-mannose 4,6 dehydratase, partial [Clostridium sp.]